MAEPFDAGGPRRFEIGRIAADHHVDVRTDRLASVDADARRVRTITDLSVEYDALLVAVGGRPDVGVPGALTFAGGRDVPAYRRLLDDVAAGLVARLGFAVPAHVA